MSKRKLIPIDKAKGHQVYKLANGTQVPGVTTIIGVMDKPALKYWANDLGLQGVDVRKYTDTLADMGTLAHGLVQSDLGAAIPEFHGYSQQEQDHASNSLRSYYQWRKGFDMEPIDVPGLTCMAPGIEVQMVSEEHRYGGTLDIFAKVRDKRFENAPWLNTLIDIKTGSGIYWEYSLQIAALRALLEEHGQTVHQQIVLLIPRTEDERFEARGINLIPEHMELFLTCREVYRLRKIVKD